jgi:hypothetical protein
MAKITIQPLITTPSWHVADGDDPTLQIASLSPFYASTGELVLPIFGNGAGAFYVEIPLTLTNSGTVLNIPSVVIDSTSDSSLPVALYTATIWAQGRSVATLLQNFGVPATPTTTTWELLTLFTQFPMQLFATSPTDVQVRAWIDQALGNLRKASVTQLGNTAISVDAVDPNFPIAAGDNDPRLADLPLADASTTVKGVTKLSVAPVSASSPIAVGDNDQRVNPVAVFDGNADPYNAVVSNSGIANNGARITAALQAATDWAIANRKTSVSIQLTPGVYWINDSLSLVNGARAQIVLPFITYTDSIHLTLEPKGGYSGGPTFPGWTTSTQGDNSIILRSTLTGLSYNGTDGTPFVIGSTDQVHAIFGTQNQNWLTFATRDVGIIVPADPTIGGLNGISLARLEVHNYSCHAQSPDPTAYPTTYTEPTHKEGVAILVPSLAGDGSEYTGKTDIAGMYAGIGVGEIIKTEGELNCYLCKVAINIEGTQSHAMTLGLVQDTRNQYGIATIDPAVGVVPIPIGFQTTYRNSLTIEKWDIEEESSGWNTRVAAIYDTASRLAGSANIYVFRQGLGNELGLTNNPSYARNFRFNNQLAPFWRQDWLYDPLRGPSSDLQSLTGHFPQISAGGAAWVTLGASGTETPTSLIFAASGVRPLSVLAANTVDPKTQNYIVSVNGAFLDSSNSLEVVFRKQDNDHYWKLTWQSGTATLYKKTAANTYVSMATASVAASVNIPYMMVVTANLAIIDCYVNGTHLTTVVDTDYQNSTPVGIQSAGVSEGAVFNDFRVTPL